MPQSTLKLTGRPDDIGASIIAVESRRILRIPQLPEDIARILTVDEPLIRSALSRPEVVSHIIRGRTDQATAIVTRWTSLMEADLLLESGGDPDAVSPAQAAGVSQWLAGTAESAGLKVDPAASRRLTLQIQDLDRRIAWLKYLAVPGSDPHAAGAPEATRGRKPDSVARLKALRVRLRARRAQVDARFDPAQAISAQARYLSHLYSRFPGIDWLYQAYHGGVTGVTQYLRSYLSERRRGSLPSRGRGMRAPSYEDFYLTVSPLTYSRAFAALYNRGDDHRHYWWKLRACAEVIDVYRRNPALLTTRWAAALPGRPAEAAWYPNAQSKVIPDAAALRADLAAHILTGVPAGAGVLPAPAGQGVLGRSYAVLRVPALGALLLLDRVYNRAGGRARLALGELTTTQADMNRARSERESAQPQSGLWPPNTQPLPGGGPPADFNYHLTGLAFDLVQPSAPATRRLLEFALTYLGDRDVITWRTVRSGASARYHVVPNPTYSAALAGIVVTRRMPRLAGL